MFMKPSRTICRALHATTLLVLGCVHLLVLAETPSANSGDDASSATAQPAKGCQCSYGTQPGMWTTTASEGEGWTVFDGDCTTQNLLFPLTSRPSPGSRALNILMFGDSVDGCLMNAWCGYLVNATRQEVDQWPLNKWHDRIRLSYCQTRTRLNIAHYFNVGVHPSGPYYENNVWNYTERLQKAREAIVEQWGTDMPDIVVASSGLWDVARLVTLSEQEWLALGQPKDKVKAGFIAQHLALPRPFLDSWARNMTRLLGAARAAFPQALVVTHTVATIDHEANGTSKSRPLGRSAYYSQISAATRQVAASLGMPFIDFERMSAALGPEQYLQDHHHPSDRFLLEALNLVLNTYEQRRRCGALPGGGYYGEPLAGADADAAEAAGGEE